MRLLIGIFVALIAVLAIMVVVLFVQPSTGEIGEVDAIVQLSGEARRLDIAVTLAEAGHAPVLALSFGSAAMCRGELDYEVICFEPDPVNTRGEAAAIGRLVDEHGWETIAVVTSTHHVSRSYQTVRHCTDAQVRMVDAGTDLRKFTAWVAAVTHEAIGFLAGLVLAPDC